MKLIGILIYILIAAFVLVFLYGFFQLIVSFFGLLFDDLTGMNTYFMWSLS